MILNGGPAFPRPASEFTKSGTCADGNDAIHEQDGMTLRDYLAAHAPHNHGMPLWDFDVAGLPPRPVPDYAGSDEFINEAINQKEIDAWNDLRFIRRMAQWPWVWADAMLAERTVDRG